MPRTKSVWLTNHITVCPNLKEAKKMLGSVSQPKPWQMQEGDNMEEDTVCYTYKVEMIIHLLSDSEPKAAETLEKNGGYVSSRKVTLIDSVPLIKG